ncbi:MAG: hypothetical protein FJZ43_03640 [Candidatus Staskawiczbacteria bacterium]|nr:hypothetical protein [Candidatus Staskawiczbacteria bacterium]
MNSLRTIVFLILSISSYNLYGQKKKRLIARLIEYSDSLRQEDSLKLVEIESAEKSIEQLEEDILILNKKNNVFNDSVIWLVSKMRNLEVRNRTLKWDSIQLQSNQSIIDSLNNTLYFYPAALFDSLFVTNIPNNKLDYLSPNDLFINKYQIHFSIEKKTCLNSLPEVGCIVNPQDIKTTILKDYSQYKNIPWVNEGFLGLALEDLSLMYSTYCFYNIKNIESNKVIGLKYIVIKISGPNDNNTKVILNQLIRTMEIKPNWFNMY